MEKTFYQLLSYLFHPIFIPLYIVGLCFISHVYPFYFLSSGQKSLLLMMLLTNTLFLPLIGVFFMKRYGMISSYHMEDRKERLLPYLYFFALYVITAFMLMMNDYAPQLLAYIYFVAAALIFILVLFNSYIKISAHAASIASLTTILYILDLKQIINLDVSIVVGILICGLVGTARLSLKAHSFKELSLGYLSGIGITFLASYLVLY